MGDFINGRLTASKYGFIFVVLLAILIMGIKIHFRNTNTDTPETMKDVEENEQKLTQFEKEEQFFKQDQFSESVSDSNMGTEHFVTNVRFASFFYTDEEHEKYRNMSGMHRLLDRCCKAETTWRTPETMTDVNGVERKIAQFAKKKQFFKHDECIRLDPQCLCLCAVERTLVSGIYEVAKNGKNTIHDVGIFPTDSCCKCLHV